MISLLSSTLDGHCDLATAAVAIIVLCRWSAAVRCLLPLHSMPIRYYVGGLLPTVAPQLAC